ncbi:MAG: hypothetical protein M3T55_13285 [Pseudomonadota bacterium]|nr:hypothetical protein [Pseudomonadota bacterium]
MAGEAQTRQASRQAIGLIIYRGLVTVALLTSGFIAFPDHKTVFALAVIAFGLGVEALAQVQRIARLADARLLDLAERKTRHTITLAQDRGLRGETCNDYTFWGEVDGRVTAELGEEDPKPPWWRSTGLTTWNVMSRLLADLFLVLLALVLSGNH